jgi:hypothetical protein
MELRRCNHWRKWRYNNRYFRELNEGCIKFRQAAALIDFMQSIKNKFVG